MFIYVFIEVTMYLIQGPDPGAVRGRYDLGGNVQELGGRSTSNGSRLFHSALLHKDHEVRG
jgi:hypothetical protein